MDVALLDAGSGEADECRLAAHLLQALAAGITHGGAQAAHHLVDDGAQRPLVRHPAFYALGHQLFDLVILLEIPVRGTVLLRHGTQGTHAAVGFVGTPLEQFHLAGGFLGAGKQTAYHNSVRASGQGLGDITGVAYAAVGDERDARTLEGRGHAEDGRDLRHAHAGHDTGGTDGARTNAHLDRIHPRLNQGLGAVGGSHITAYDLGVGVMGFDPLHHVQHTLGMTMGRIHHQHIHAGFDQGRYPVFRTLAHTHGGAHAQGLVLVLAGVGKFLCLVYVLDRHQTAQFVIIVDHQHLLYAEFVQQGRDLVFGGAFLDGHQLVLLGHDVLNRVVVVRLEAQVTAGDYAHQFRAVDHGNPGDVMHAGQAQDLAYAGVGVDGNGIADDAGLEFLHHTHLPGLLLRAHVLVDDAYTAFLGHGDGQAPLGDGVHGGRQKGDIQPDGGGQLGLQTDFSGQDLGVGGNQQYIVESQGFFANTHFRERPDM